MSWHKHILLLLTSSSGDYLLHCPYFQFDCQSEDCRKGSENSYQQFKRISDCLNWSLVFRFIAWWHVIDFSPCRKQWASHKDFALPYLINQMYFLVALGTWPNSHHECSLHGKRQLEHREIEKTRQETNKCTRRTNLFSRGRCWYARRAKFGHRKISIKMDQVDSASSFMWSIKKINHSTGNLSDPTSKSSCSFNHLTKYLFRPDFALNMNEWFPNIVESLNLYIKGAFTQTTSNSMWTNFRNFGWVSLS
jgi:hypothetical protein